MSNDFQELLDFVWAESEKVPMPRRARILRGLARVVGDAREQRELVELAQSLEVTDKLCREFKFSFIQPDSK